MNSELQWKKWNEMKWNSKITKHNKTGLYFILFYFTLLTFVWINWLELLILLLIIFINWNNSFELLINNDFVCNKFDNMLPN